MKAITNARIVLEDGILENASLIFDEKIEKHKHSQICRATTIIIDNVKRISVLVQIFATYYFG